MKFSLKRMLGLLALGGAVAYVQKKKGLKNAGQSLKEMFQNKLGGKGENRFASHEDRSSMGMRDTGMSGVRSGLGPNESTGGFDDEARGGFGEDITRRPI